MRPLLAGFPRGITVEIDRVPSTFDNQNIVVVSPFGRFVGIRGVNEVKEMLKTFNAEGHGNDNVMFKLHNPYLYSEVLVVTDGKPYLKTHIVVPIKKINDAGEPLYIAMKPVEVKPQEDENPAKQTGGAESTDHRVSDAYRKYLKSRTGEIKARIEATKPSPPSSPSPDLGAVGHVAGGIVVPDEVWMNGANAIIHYVHEKKANIMESQLPNLPAPVGFCDECGRPYWGDEQAGKKCGAGTRDTTFDGKTRFCTGKLVSFDQSDPAKKSNPGAGRAD